MILSKYSKDRSPTENGEKSGFPAVNLAASFYPDSKTQEAVFGTL